MTNNEKKKFEEVIALMNKNGVSGFIATDKFCSSFFQNKNHLLALLDRAELEKVFLDKMNEVDALKLMEQRNNKNKKIDIQPNYVG